MGPTGDCYRIVQIHPTRQCNLRCLHCYSSSSPEERGSLPAAVLCEAISDCATEGYTVASFSGGEPILYQPLGEILDHSHRCGLVTTVTSNGMLLDQRRLEMLTGRADLLAISLDGIPESHNRMRADPRAFDTMASRLEGVRISGIPFGFIFTLTVHNLHELDWVAKFALEQGAKLLQIHPLEVAGRAKETLLNDEPDAVESAYAYLESERVQEMAGGRMVVQLDLLNSDRLRNDPDWVFAGEPGDDGPDNPLAALVSPLVIEADGMVVPIEYGFSREYAFGNLHECPLSASAPIWKRQIYPRFQNLCRQVFEEVTAPSDLPFTNWYAQITARSGQPIPALAPAAV